MRYFRIEDSFAVRDRWHLSDPKEAGEIEVDSRLFTAGKKYFENRVLEIAVEKGATPLDFTFGPFDMPVVKSALGKAIESLASSEIQRIPASIGGRNDYEILNLLTVQEAIDEDRSEISRWTEADGWPAKVGQYFAIGDLVLGEQKINGSKIFRLKNWELPLIVCETIKQKLEDLDTTGISFKELKVV